MSEVSQITELNDDERLWVQRTANLGLRICGHYLSDVPDAVDSETLDEVFVAWRQDPLEQKPTPNDVANGLGVLYGIEFKRRFALDWRTMTDKSGSSLCLYRAQPGKEQAQIIISPLHMVAKRVKETQRWFEGTFYATCQQLQRWEVPKAPRQ